MIKFRESNVFQILVSGVGVVSGMCNMAKHEVLSRGLVIKRYGREYPIQNLQIVFERVPMIKTFIE